MMRPRANRRAMTDAGTVNRVAGLRTPAGS
jgi:hypothetical protein